MASQDAFIPFAILVYFTLRLHLDSFKFFESLNCWNHSQISAMGEIEILGLCSAFAQFKSRSSPARLSPFRSKMNEIAVMEWLNWCFNHFILLEYLLSKKSYRHIFKAKKSHLLLRILTDYHLKSKNSFKRDDTRNIIQAWEILFKHHVSQIKKKSWSCSLNNAFLSFWKFSLVQ
jgi:hypothetical protein